MKLFDSILRFYTSIRKLDSFSVYDFHGRMKSWMKTGMLAVRIFFVKDMWTRDVAALTFASFMALIPFMAMLFVIARGFGYTALLESWISTTFESQPVVAQTIVNFVHNYIENTKGDYILGTGIVMFLYTVVSLMQKIELTFDEIWRAEVRSWRKVLSEYPTIFLGLGLLILFASSINVWAVNAVNRVDGYVDMGDAIPSFLLHLAAFVPMFLFFVYFYWVLPNTYVRLRSTLLPACLAGVSMTALQYGYIYLQMYLSSYNVIYGSLAALPLFLLWLQISWAITVLGAILSYIIQNLHLYDGDIQYGQLRAVVRLKVCALVMHHVCKRFGDGEEACTPREIHEVTKLPQQVVNGAVEELLRARLLVELRERRHGSRMESSMLHPIEHIGHLTYGMMVGRLACYGEDLPLADKADWQDIDLVNNAFIGQGMRIELADLRRGDA